MIITTTKRVTAAAVAILASWSATFAQTAPTDSLTLTLDQCLAIALDSNPTIKIADIEITRVDYDKKSTLGKLLPSISFDGNYGRTLAKQTMYMNFSGMGGLGGGSSESPSEEEAEAAPSRSSGDGGIKVGLDNTYSVGFSASLPIIAPQLWASLKLSDAQILESVEKARQSRLSLENQVKAAYYALIFAEDSRRVILQNYDMAAYTARQYKLRYELTGTASEFDTLRTAVAMRNIEPQITQADIAVRQARLQLNILMGIDAATQVKTPVSLEDLESTLSGKLLSLNLGLENNTDLKLLDIQSQQLKQATKIAKLAFVPTLALAFNYNWTSMNNGTPFKDLRWNPYSQIGLSLSVPLFQGGQRYNAVKQSEIQQRQLAWQRDYLEQSLTSQVDISLKNIQLNLKQIGSCARNVEQASEAYRISRESFDLGAATYLDLRDSELALTQAKLARLQAIYNYLVAFSELEYLVGNESK